MLVLSGQVLKQQGQQLVLANQAPDWTEAAKVLMLKYIKAKGPCLAEDARLYAVACGLQPPRHHNSWGAVVGALSTEGRITMTGELEHARTPLSHGRIMGLWVAIDPALKCK